VTECLLACTRPWVESIALQETLTFGGDELAMSLEEETTCGADRYDESLYRKSTLHSVFSPLPSIQPNMCSSEVIKYSSVLMYTKTSPPQCTL
jgi:peroxiredoxin